VTVVAEDPADLSQLVMATDERPTLLGVVP
jgi:hypothetical protein